MILEILVFQLRSTCQHFKGMFNSSTSIEGQSKEEHGLLGEIESEPHAV